MTATVAAAVRTPSEMTAVMATRARAWKGGPLSVVEVPLVLSRSSRLIWLR